LRLQRHRPAARPTGYARRDGRGVAVPRSPIGRKKGTLAGVHPADLAAHPIRELVSRTGIDAGAVDASESGGPLPDASSSSVDAAPTGYECHVFELTAADEAIVAVHAAQFAGQFLVDRDGIVRWCWTEAPTSANELCRFPSAAEMIEAARGLATLQT